MLADASRMPPRWGRSLSGLFRRKRAPNDHWRLREPPHLWLVLVLVPAGLLGACSTISEDLGDFAKSLMPPSPGEAARQMFDPHDPDLRRQGLVLVSNASFGGAELYVEAYRGFVETEDDPLVLAMAIRALARHGSAEDAPLIARHLSDENVHVKWAAAKGLQRLHNPEVVPALLEILYPPPLGANSLAQDEEQPSDVRVATAYALGQYPERRVFEGLFAALRVRELSVNVAASDALTVLTGQEYGLDMRAWRDWYDATADPFAGQQEYLYPTFQRPVSWLEKLAFWSPPVFEQPAPPTGLRPPSQRRTYQDEEPPDSGEPGG